MTEQYTVLRRFRHGAAHQLLCLKYDSYIGRAVELYGEYSEAEVDVFRAFVRPEDVCIDGGALFGEHTLALADLCPAGHVIAFEPQRIPFQMLCGNAQLNSADNIDAERAALGALEGHTRIEPLSPYCDSPWGLTKAGTHGERVRVRTIDSLNLKRLDFVKLDLEGAEPDAILGAKETFLRCRPILYVEFNYNRDAILATLAMCGYFDYWRHRAPVHRVPNYTGRPLLEGVPMPDPSDMLLAMPPLGHRVMPDHWPMWSAANGFESVKGAQ
jgi:FkbM family methyltransferase